jgi:hypothetical protein
MADCSQPVASLAPQTIAEPQRSALQSIFRNPTAAVWEQCILDHGNLLLAKRGDS